ncbi:hypothetical protein JHD50_13330 [Sulfurimonas sp. MAG313]|nr:hypothetical protein [Sulfurimonas sp. MAG313]MDF1882270.1 hypothetical protein [Sulfurimonas sp. MAG313]
MTGLQKLQSIGAHKIFETTHISKKFVEDILKQNFSSMTKIQFFGFVSIIEREYSVDLHELNDAYLAHAQSTGEDEPFSISEQNDVETKTTPKAAYIFVGLLVIGALFMLFKPAENVEIATAPILLEKKKNDGELNSSSIEQAKANLTNLELSASKEVEKVEETMVEPMHTSRFEIKPRSKLWIGIVDLETFKRSQKMSAKSFELDPDKEWLLVMGHGYVNFEVNGLEQNFKDKNKVWFSYENAILTKLTRSEFTKKNRGKAW